MKGHLQSLYRIYMQTKAGSIHLIAYNACYFCNVKTTQGIKFIRNSFHYPGMLR